MRELLKKKKPATRKGDRLSQITRCSRDALLNGVFELAASAELRHSHGWDFDFLASLWVTASAGFALGLGEGAEADEGDIVALLHALLDGVESGVDHGFRVNLGHLGVLSNGFDQLSFVHFSLSP